MFKVIVIDDEPIVRKGIVSIINWQSMGCKIVGEAANGVEGIKLIESIKPDIILTDIHMPEIDGLEMIKRTIDLIPWSKIIVLTGYRDFDYIQEALKLGAAEYLLKPSKIDEITTAVKKACLELEYKNRKDKSIKRLEEHYRRSLPLLKEKLLFDLLLSKDVSEDVEEELELYKLNINQFIMVSIDVNHSDRVDIYQKQLYKIGIKNAFLEIFSDAYVCESVDVTPARSVFIILSEKNDIQEDVYKKAESFQLITKSCFDIDMTLGISTLGYGYKDLYEKMKECERALSYKLYLGHDALIIYDDIKTLNLSDDNYTLENLKANIYSAIKIGNVKLLTELNHKLIELVNDDNYKEIYRELISNVSKVGFDEINKMLSDNLKSCHEAYLSLSKVAVESVKDVNIKNLSNVLKQSLDYIKDNFQNSISLQDVADYTYVSTYYLSRMFKKEIGKNFVDYLNEYRINKSKSYLMDYELKTYEVAELVGINDAHYFSKLFKKYTGITPTEYRNKV